MKVKKSLLLLASLLLVPLASCNEQQPVEKEKYTLPNLYGKSVKEAKLEVGANILFNEVNVPTHELIEGKILGYKEFKSGDKVDKGTRVEVNVAKREDTAKNVDNNLIAYNNVITKLTGPDSINEEILLNSGAGGTDLGIPFELPDGRMMLLYGDTFAGQNMTGYWNSNFMAISSDFTLNDGLTFDEVITNDRGMILPFAQGKHQQGSVENIGSEVTKIPTGGISIGNDVYIFYMSIRYWGVAGSWLVSYSQCLKAKDNTYTVWEEVPFLKREEDELFYAGQIYPFNNPQDKENIYFLSIPGGRNHGAVMFRVNKDNFENRDEYEYLVSNDTWVKGDEGMKKLNEKPYFIVDPSVSEPSIMYSTYLNKWVVSTLRGSSLILATSDKVTGPYKEVYSYLNSADYIGIYGGFVHEKYTDSNGQRIYIQLSQWTPIYNTSLVEVVLK